MAGDQNPQQRVMPTLRMTDYARSKKFYVDGLGFQVDWEHRFEPSFPVFVRLNGDREAKKTAAMPLSLHGSRDARQCFA